MMSAINQRRNSAPKKPIKKPHVCTFEGCKASFSRPYRLSQHLLVHSNVKSFLCPEKDCSKSYTNKSHLDRHINSVHIKMDNDVLYSCPTCFKSYANRQNLKRHLKLHSLKSTYKCDICKEEFQKKHQLSTHVYKHTGVKAFSCEHCPADFISLIEKKKHMRCHKTYTCDHCKEMFNHWSKFQKHLKTDHEPKIYSCNECDRSFKYRIHIVRHIRQGSCIRVEIKSYTCPFENCKKSYKRNSNLRQHILSKHENIRFQCSVCESTLSTKAKLNQHIKKIHEATETKEKIPKTIESGRKHRKDIGTIKVFTALKLSGMIVEETCSANNLPQGNVEIK